ncbi:MAG: tripartite tricarboxylate transporter substrate binding protein [Burkholderiales bacterium]|nr:tripartite tricarboxylate transporter substrate binding protein [Burkholderiales bacterium]
MLTWPRFAQPSHDFVKLASIASTVLVAVTVMAAQGSAQTYPSRPLRIVVPFAPGGGSDIMARVVATRLTEPLGQQVLVDNRPGGGTLIGAELAARSAADGYTLFLSTNGTVAINPSLYKKLPYDVAKDFAPVALIGVGPNVLVVHPSLPVKSVRDLIALAKAHPGKLSYASSGVGGAPHLAGELFKSMAGVDMLHVPYKGASPATTDLLAGHVQVMFAGLGPAIAHIKVNRLRGIAVASAKRSQALPQLPAIGETLKDFEASSWFALFVPAATPNDIIAKLNAEIVKAMARKDVHQQLMAQGYEPITSTPEELAEIVKRDTARWARVIKSAGITAE